MDRRKAKAALFSFVKVDPITKCWIWFGSRNPRYGRLCFEGEQWLTHRLSFQIYNGQIPSNHVIHHRCSTKLCINPGHLRAIPQAQNIKLAAERGTYKGEKNRNNRLSESQVFTVKILREIKGLTLREISEQMNIPVATVGDVARGRTWAHLQL